MFGTIIVMQVGVGWIFIRWLLNSDRGPKEPKKLLITAGVLGFLASIAALVLEIFLIPDNLIEHSNSYSTDQLLRYSLLIGLIEEACKAIPLALVLLFGKFIDEVTDGLIYFGIAGMVFGVLEDIGYSLSLGPVVGIGKIITGPFIHAGFCVLIGWAIASVKIQRRPWILAVGGFAAAIGLHALYDFGLFYQQVWSILLSLLITLFVNLNIFWLFRAAKRADSRLGIAATGVNRYCRSCGKPNPNHYLYCIYCGQRT